MHNFTLVGATYIANAMPANGLVYLFSLTSWHAFNDMIGVRRLSSNKMFRFFAILIVNFCVAQVCRSVAFIALLDRCVVAHRLWLTSATIDSSFMNAALPKQWLFLTDRNARMTSARATR